MPNYSKTVTSNPSIFGRRRSAAVPTAKVRIEQIRCGAGRAFQSPKLSTAHPLLTETHTAEQPFQGQH